MLSEIQAGESHTLERLVEEKYCTTRGAHQIFSTPDLVLLLEETAIELLAPFLPDEQSSVGSKVDIAHTAPTLLGQTVWCTATVTVVDRRRVEFQIEARDDADDAIATGTHERFVVDLGKFEERLAAKAAA
jgi:predicted thioesterase